MSRLYALAAAAVAAAALGAMAGYALWPRGGDDAFAQCRSGAAGGDIGGPFTLIDKDGRTVTDTDVITAPTLVYFGYTFCPDVCPLDMSLNAEAVDILEEQGHKVNLVFVSIDPARDTAKVVGDFASNIHPRAIGLTGSEAQVAAAAKAYRAYFKKQDGDPEFYLVDHSAFTYLVLPGLGFMDFFKHDTPADQRAAGVSCFLEAAAQ
ncbi:SCO family protein [Rhodobacter sp. Har01]|uniref:SCO family protein n=1 Tax=Rhodobacter sp. Har01 TaxID=2883999 RepID=UPI001D07D39E|nr:SCO family protein [Rhodobacter sp. Har01]MCB6177900.1 SCO family protein [Rhodobacter sp. Har01]